MAAGPLRRVMQHIHQMVGGSSTDALTDRQLLERFAQRREERAFAALVERHGPLVLGVCRRVLRHEHDAEDAFQATFQVLARKANALGWHDSVANWLYEVALRVSHKTRSNAQRRQAREQQGTNVEPAATAQDAWHELKPVLDEELSRLPRKLRAPLVLCYLEGKTRDEAAAELGWSLGTVKGRLERGRDMLRNRLVKRGLSLAAALVAVGLAEGSAPAAVPAALATATVEGAATGVVSAPVAALTQGAIKTMFLTRMQGIGAAVLALAVVAGGLGYALHRAGAQPHAPVVADAAPLPENTKAEPALPEKLRGQKVLVAYDATGDPDRARKHFEQALAKADIAMVEHVPPHLFLVDCKGQKPQAALKDLHHRLGAIVFKDGQYVESIAYDSPFHKGMFLTPEPFVGIQWGSGAANIKQMERDLEEYGTKPGIVAEKINLRPGEVVFGNPWLLKLTPGKGKTLLEVFLETKRGFYYVEKKTPH